MKSTPAPGTPRRVNVRGTTGAGKTQFSSGLASRLGIPHIELDALHWGPGWSEPEPASFRDTVRAVMDANPKGWVIDGGYDSKLGEMVVGAADTIVWIDLPLTVTMFRLLRRTVLRVIGGVELWNGNRENLRDQFASRDSIFLWAFDAHRRHRRAWSQAFADDPRLVRLRTRAGVRRWLEAFAPTGNAGQPNPHHPIPPVTDHCGRGYGVGATNGKVLHVDLRRIPKKPR